MIKRPILVSSIFSLVVIMGFSVFFQFPISMFPDINYPGAYIKITYPKASVQEVEKTVVDPIEALLFSLKGLKKMTSESTKNGGHINLLFEFGEDVDKTVTRARDLINDFKVHWPKEVSVSLYPYSFSSGPVASLVLLGDRSQAELRQIAEKTIKNRFLQIDGVASVNILGGQRRVVRIEVSQDRLLAFGLSMSLVASALEQQDSQETSCGWIGNTAVYTVNQFQSLDDIGSVVVGKKGSYLVLLRDIADIESGYKDEKDSFSFFNGKSNVSIDVTKKKTGNTIVIMSEMKKVLSEIKNLVPEDIQLHITEDNSELIKQVSQNLTQTAFQTIFLAILVIFLFLRRGVATLLIGLSIPVALFTTFLFMHFFHLTLNIMTMIGLIMSIGMVVDSSIVVMENIIRYKERGVKKHIAAAIGSKEVRSSVIASTLTTVCLFVPFLIFKSALDVYGILFEELFLTIVISLFASLAVALFLIPVLMAALSKNAPLSRKNTFLNSTDRLISQLWEKFTALYRFCLDLALHHRLIVILLVVVSFLGSCLLAPSFGEIQQESPLNPPIKLRVTLPAGTKPSEVKDLMVKIDEIARKNITRWKSTRISSHDNKGWLVVTLQDESVRKQVQEGQNILRQRLQDFPDVDFSFNQEYQEGDFSQGERITFQSQNDELAFKTALNAKEIIKNKVPQAAEVSLEQNWGEPYFEVMVDRQKANALDVSLSDLTQELQQRFGGKEANIEARYLQQDLEYPLILTMKDQNAQDLTDFQTIYVPNRQKKLIELLSVAKVEKKPGKLAVIRHENRLRSVTLNVRMSAGEKGMVHHDIRKAIEENLIVDSQVQVLYAGGSMEMKSLFSNVLLLVTLTIVLAFGVMAAQYESLKNPLINLFTIPPMVIGAFILLFVSKANLDPIAMIGFLLLVGIVINNGIILVDCINLSRARGLNTIQACLQAGVLRLRPILMTSVTTISGMILLAFSSKMFLSLSLVIIGGLTSSCLVTLFLIPVMYSLFNKEACKKS